MVGRHYGAMSAIDVLFQSHSFINTIISLINFHIAVLFCVNFKTNTASLPGLQHTMFLVLNQIVTTYV